MVGPGNIATHRTIRGDVDRLRFTTRSYPHTNGILRALPDCHVENTDSSG
jgi:hypothetical protein